MLELLGKKYFHVFTAGEYPQGNVTVEMLLAVSASYNKSFKEAPVWRGHPSFPDSGNNEPEALGWIDSLLVYGDKLYVSFSDMSEDLIELLDEKKFKYCSVEIVEYSINGINTPYLFALGLTNRPAVHNLEPLQLPARYTENHKMNNDFRPGSRITFNLNLPNQNKNSMNQFLIQIAKAMGVDVSKYTDDSKLADAMTVNLNESKAKFTELTEKVVKLEKAPADGDPKLQEYSERIATLEKQRCNDLADNAVASGKILPAQKDSIVKFAESDYDAAKSYVDALPVSALFAANKVNTNSPAAQEINIGDKKFLKPDGTHYTYAEVIKDAALVKNFTDAELLTLRNDKSYGL